MTGPLAGVRVLDLSCGPAGGAATMVLADFGADVIKIEPPGGDPFRFLAAAPMWLRGKRSLVLDLKANAGVARLHELASDADVAVSSFRPGTAERLSADYATLATVNSRLVYCAITGFGPRGPYRRYKGYEALVAAKSGRMVTFTGQLPRPGPAYAAVQVGTHVASQSAVQGIVAALLAREATGRGQLVETSLLQGMLPYDMGGLLIEQLRRRFPAQFPDDPLQLLLRTPTLQYQPVLTGDGKWMQLANLVEHLFHSYIAAAGLTDLYADERYAALPVVGEAEKEEIRALMLERMRERPLDEWMAEFIADGNVASEPIVSTQAALSHPQAVHNGHVRELEHPRLGRVRQIGPIAKLPKTPAEPSPASPEPGESVGAAFAARTVAPREAPQRSTRPPRHPLEGVTVVEFATIIATPYACSLLADLGARVIKIESLEGDGFRGMGNGIGTVKTTAGKESICVDLKTEAGREVARRLVERADVLIHNFRVGVPERLGIGYEQVAAYNPQIVYISATGYGETGPYARRPSAHPAAGAAMGGVLWQAGSAMPPASVDGIDEVKEYARRFYRANELNPDPNTSMVVASAALLGLYARKLRGIGQHIETDMLIGNAYANLDDFLSYEGKPPRPPVDAELFGLGALYRLYETAEGWIFLACVFEAEWQALCRALPRPDLANDPRFSCAESRREHDAELAALLAEEFCRRSAEEWEALLSSHDVGCVRADKSTAGVFWDSDAHVLENGFTREAEHLRWGPYWRHGPLVTLSSTPERAGAGVLAGQNTSQLLRELGYSADAIAALRSAGVVRSEEP
ncbi:MAG TPA: CoA transferase [Dehalococcoidia bacterium]|nr:CoA transferase [Dehalococcoidia bacterium]